MPPGSKGIRMKSWLLPSMASLLLAGVSAAAPRAVTHGDLVVHVWEAADYLVHVLEGGVEIRQARVDAQGQRVVDAEGRPVYDPVPASALGEGGRQGIVDLQLMTEYLLEGLAEDGITEGPEVRQARRGFHLLEIRPATEATPGFAALQQALSRPAVQEAYHHMRLAELARGDTVGDTIPDTVLRPRSPYQLSETFFKHRKGSFADAVAHGNPGCKRGGQLVRFTGTAAWFGNAEAILGLYNRPGAGVLEAARIAEVLPHELGHAHEGAAGDRAQTYLEPFAHPRDSGDHRSLEVRLRAGIEAAGGTHLEFQSYQGPLAFKEAYAHFYSWAVGNPADRDRWRRWEEHRRRLSEAWDQAYERAPDGTSARTDGEGRVVPRQDAFGQPVDPDAGGVERRGRVRSLDAMLRSEGVIASILIDFADLVDGRPRVQGTAPFDGRQVVQEIVHCHLEGARGIGSYEQFRAQVHRLFPELAVDLFAAESANTLGARMDQGSAGNRFEVLEMLRDGRAAELSAPGRFPDYLPAYGTEAEAAYRAIRSRVTEGARVAFFALSRFDAPGPQALQDGRRARARWRSARNLGSSGDVMRLYREAAQALDAVPAGQREAHVARMRDLLAANQLFLERARTAAGEAGQTGRAELLYPRKLEQNRQLYQGLRQDAARLGVEPALLPESLAETRAGAREVRAVPGGSVPRPGRAGAAPGGGGAATSAAEAVDTRDPKDLGRRVEAAQRARSARYQRYRDSFLAGLRAQGPLRSMAGHANFFAAMYMLTLYRLASLEPDLEVGELIDRAAAIAFSPESLGTFLLFVAVDHPFQLAAAELARVAEGLRGVAGRSARLLMRNGARAVGAAGTFVALFVTEGAIQALDVAQGDATDEELRTRFLATLDTVEGRQARAVARAFFDLSPEDILRSAFDPNRMDYWKIAVEGAALVAASLAVSATGQVWLAPWAALAAAASAGHLVDVSRAEDFSYQAYRAAVRDRVRDATSTSLFEGRPTQSRWVAEIQALIGPNTAVNSELLSLRIKEQSEAVRLMGKEAAVAMAGLTQSTQLLRGRLLDVAVHALGKARYFAELRDIYQALLRRPGTRRSQLDAFWNRHPFGFKELGITEEPERSFFVFYNQLAAAWGTGAGGFDVFQIRDGADVTPMVPALGRELTDFFARIGDDSPAIRGPVVRGTACAGLMRTAWMQYHQADLLLRGMRQVLEAGQVRIDGLIRHFADKDGVVPGFETVLEIQRTIEAERVGSMLGSLEEIRRELRAPVDGAGALTQARIMWQFVMYPWREALGLQHIPVDDQGFQTQHRLGFTTMRQGAARIFGQGGGR